MPEFARFDQRHYPTVSVRDGYRDWTPTYEQTVEDVMDLALLERVATIAWPELDRVADLGCGTGRTGAWIRSKSRCRLDGVDLTPEMLELARRRGIYERLDAADLADNDLPAAAYDAVVACLVDEHLEDLGPLYGEAARLLRPGGRFVLVGYHPTFIMKAGMPTHFDHAERGPVAVATHVHLLSDHARCAGSSGFVAVELHEALIDDEWIRRKPRWQAHRDWPISFAWVWRLDVAAT